MVLRIRVKEHPRQERNDGNSAQISLPLAF